MKLAQLRCPDPPLPVSEASLTASSQWAALLGGGSLPRCALLPPHLAGLELPGCQCKGRLPKKVAPGPVPEASRGLEAMLGATREIAPYLAGPV